MKTILAHLLVIFLITTITPTTIFAQDINLDESSGCVVSDVKGKVTYTEKGSTKAKTVKSGTILPEDATVVVANKASFSLACEDRSLSVSKKGSYQMTALTKEVQAKGAQSRFAKMAFAAKGYGEIPPDTTRKVKGWGDKDSIMFKQPIGGKLPLQTSTFTWTPLKAGSVYKLVIYQNSKDAPVLSVITSVASFTFDPSQLAINMGQTCHAQVMLANDSKVTSKVVHFSFVSPKDAESVITSLMKDKEFSSGNAVQKSLMQAVELENQELFSMANEKYLMALKMDANNSMAKRMYVAFLDRVNK